MEKDWQIKFVPSNLAIRIGDEKPYTKGCFGFYSADVENSPEETKGVVFDAFRALRTNETPLYDGYVNGVKVYSAADEFKPGQVIRIR